MVCYDWGEAFVATNLVIKPGIDRLINQEMAGTPASANGDLMLRNIHFSLDEDARWHRDWSAALLRHLIDDTPSNADAVSAWLDKWQPLVSDALDAAAGILADAPVTMDPAGVAARISNEVSRETAAIFAARA